MNEPLLQDLIHNYTKTPLPKKVYLRELLQQAALLGLSRHNFFEHAAFYGGTALRILYGLDRMSEDLDFSLLKPNPHFAFAPFIEGMQKEMEILGFGVTAAIKKQEAPILSAFVKANTFKMMLSLTATAPQKIHPDEKISIKLEIDTNPPPKFDVEKKLVLQPTPFYVLSYTLPDLFAGKMHAILCRAWKNRVKGRDWYDLIWFIKQKIPCHVTHLCERLRQSGHLKEGEALTKKRLHGMLQERIESIDFKQAVQDVIPFVPNQDQLSIWSTQFFFDLVKMIEVGEFQ